MDAATVISVAATITLVLISAAFFLTVYRVVRGPTLPDRVVALDMLVAIAIGFIAVVAIKTGFNLYIDVAIALGLVGFLATVAFARFVLRQGMQPGEAAEAAAPKTARAAGRGGKRRAR